jgi:hypothetical protein
MNRDGVTNNPLHCNQDEEKGKEEFDKKRKGKRSPGVRYSEPLGSRGNIPGVRSISRLGFLV